MGTTVLDGRLLARMMRSGAANLYGSKDTVNDLNVFPIPDGDTGDNMFMTIDSGCRAMPDGAESLCAVGSGVASGMLHGARGNSGVILSRIAAGICGGLEGLEKADVRSLGSSLKKGVAEAYSAVSVPVEGTILTVYREAVDYMTGRITDGSTIESCMDDLIFELQEALDRTPDQLQCLKEAGVVDSGGAGLLCIAEGMKKALEGRDADYTAVQAAGGPVQPDFDLFTEDTEFKFGYCTEFMLRLRTDKVGRTEDFDESVIKEHLSETGDSLIFFRTGSIIKVHVHTFAPGDVLTYCQQFGEFLTVKIENMTLQHNETGAAADPGRFRREVRRPYGTVAVASGEGLRRTFLELGTDRVIEGGQTSNPSTEDFLRAFDEVAADTILVFPNNGNILLAAEQAASMYEKASIRVVPTVDLGQGYAALSVLDTSSGDTDLIVSSCTAAARGAVTAEVSRAVRDSVVGGVEVTGGDFIGFSGKTVLCDDPGRTEAALATAEKLDAGNYDIILVFRGRDVPKAEAEALSGELGRRFPAAEVISLDGGQAVYDYILIFE
jgi:DAK2 domain fusion protein YloV